MPIIIPVAMTAGVNPFVPALAATFAASFGFMLPMMIGLLGSGG